MLKVFKRGFHGLYSTSCPTVSLVTAKPLATTASGPAALFVKARFSAF